MRTRQAQTSLARPAAYLLLVTRLGLLHIATKLAVVQLLDGIERRRVVLLVHADHHERAQVGVGTDNDPASPSAAAA